MFANLPEGFKDIDVLLNNAGSSIGQNPAQAGNMDDWDEMIATNINGLLYCTRCVLPGMIERGSGHIVNIGSVRRQPRLQVRQRVRCHQGFREPF